PILALSLLLFVLGASTFATVDAACDLPFKDIGGRCFLVENFAKGAWADTNHWCGYYGATLAKLDDASVFAALVQEIKNSGISETFFWIGASDSAAEGNWVWLDGTPVAMGTPFWSLTGSSCTVQEPKGGTGQNCAALHPKRSYYFDDIGCTTQAGAICEKI
ncbi:C-type lectin domain-containing protein, partial [Aphanizomenon sp. 202]|nr:C-type lectin domain-containing protein [Aphanizomenon sp. 202]